MGRGHEQKEWERQPGIRARSDERLTSKLWRRGRTRARRRRDDSFVVRPDNSPNIQHHDDAVRAANSD